MAERKAAQHETKPDQDRLDSRCANADFPSRAKETQPAQCPSKQQLSDIHPHTHTFTHSHRLHSRHRPHKAQPKPSSRNRHHADIVTAFAAPVEHGAQLGSAPLAQSTEAKREREKKLAGMSRRMNSDRQTDRLARLSTQCCVRVFH